MSVKVEPSYCGDGVYASFDGYHLILTTGHHLPALAANKVYLEPDVIGHVLAYIETINKAKTEAP